MDDFTLVEHLEADLPPMDGPATLEAGLPSPAQPEAPGLPAGSSPGSAAAAGRRRGATPPTTASKRGRDATEEAEDEAEEDLGKRVVAKEDFVIVSRELWACKKEASYYDKFCLAVRKDIYKPGEALPPWTLLKKSSNSYYICLEQGAANNAAHPACLQWLSCSSENKGLKKHLSSVHKIDLDTKPTVAVQSAIKEPSAFDACKQVFKAGLAYTPFANSHGSLRTGLTPVVPYFPSPATVRSKSREIVASAVANISELLEMGPFSFTFDSSPNMLRDFAVINVHVWSEKRKRLVNIPLGLQQLTQSMTSSATKRFVIAVLKCFGCMPLSELRRSVASKGVAIFACTDSGSNVQSAAKALVGVDVPGELVCDQLPVPQTRVNCIGHTCNLLIRDAFAYGWVARIVQKIMSGIKIIRKSRIFAEELKEAGLQVPGRFVATRWRSLMKLIPFFVQHRERMSVLGDVGLSLIEAAKIGMVWGVIKTFDDVVLASQEDTPADGFFLFSRVLEALSKLKNRTGVYLLPDSLDEAPLSEETLNQPEISEWLSFFETRAHDRFLCFDSDDFVDVPEEDMDDEDDAEEYVEHAVSAAAVNPAAGAPLNQQRSNAGRFQKNNYLLHSAVLGLFALSPLKCAYDCLVDAGVVPRDQLAESDPTRDGLSHALAVRFLYDKDFAKSVTDPEVTVVSRPESGRPATGFSLFRKLVAPDSRRGSETALEAARDELVGFRDSENVRKLFERIGAVSDKGELTPAVKAGFVADWLDLARKQASWIGALMEVLVSARMRSTECESDFSFLQHILAQRRQRLSGVVLAAYMFCNRASDFVVEPMEGRVPGTNQLLLSFKGDKKEASSAASSTSTAASSTSTAASSSSVAPDADVVGVGAAVREQEAAVLTRSGQRRSVRVSEVVAQILPTRVMVQTRSGRQTSRTIFSTEDVADDEDADFREGRRLVPQRRMV